MSGPRSSFAWGMRLLPADRRTALHAVYGYCRHLDDIADSDAPAAEKTAALAGWREELDLLYAARPVHPVARALLPAVARDDLPRPELEAVIDGMMMDAAGPIRAPDWETLRLYCRRAAGAPGLLALPVFGRRGGNAEAFALALGEALQLTNILRDVQEDAGLGRLYLPREDLAAAGIAGDDPALVLADPALPQACAQLAVRADTAYAEARAALRRAGRKRLRPAVAMMAAYRRVFDHLAARGFAPGPRVSLGRWEAMAIALRCGVLGR